MKGNNPTIENGALHVLLNTVVFQADSTTLNPSCGLSYLPYTGWHRAFLRCSWYHRLLNLGRDKLHRWWRGTRIFLSPILLLVPLLFASLSDFAANEIRGSRCLKNSTDYIGLFRSFVRSVRRPETIRDILFFLFILREISLNLEVTFHLRWRCNW